MKGRSCGTSSPLPSPREGLGPHAQHTLTPRHWHCPLLAAFYTKRDDGLHPHHRHPHHLGSFLGPTACHPPTASDPNPCPQRGPQRDHTQELGTAGDKNEPILRTFSSGILRVPTSASLPGPIPRGSCVRLVKTLLVGRVARFERREGPMSAGCSGRSGMRRWTTCPVGTRAHLRTLSSAPSHSPLGCT